MGGIFCKQDLFCHCKVNTKLNFKSLIQICQTKFFSCLRLSKMCSTSVFLKDRLNLKTQNGNVLNLDNHGVKMAVTHFVTQITHVSSHFGVQNRKKKNLRKTV